MKKAMVLISGGIDSTTCLAIAAEKYGSENVVGLSIYYGQKHEREVEAARRVAEHYGCEHMTLDLTPIFAFSDCALLKGSSRDIPHSQYAEQTEMSGGKPVATYVPFRNGLFLSAAASVALSKGCSVIYYGAHGDDAAGNAYPDCSEEFNKAMADAINLGSGGELKVEAPFVGKSKAYVVETGIKYNAPYRYTWSCYEGGDKPCGKCATCIDRAKAFAANNMADPYDEK